MFRAQLNLTMPYNTTMSEYLGMSEATRWVLLAINFVMLTIGIFGNGIVLICSLQFRAIKMDQCSRLFMENIAIADILIILVKVLPRVTVIIFDGWKLGKVICFASVALKISLFIAESLVTTGMACYRLHVLKTLVTVIKYRSVRGWITFCWCLAFIYVTVLIGANMVAYFDPFLMGCGTVVMDGKWKRFQQLAGILLSFVPILVILITNIWILAIAGRYTRKRTGQFTPSRSAVTMVMCICWAFVLSWVPYLVVWVCGLARVKVDPAWRSVAEHAITINAIINPFIYTATNNTFRLFLKDLVCGSGLLCTSHHRVASSVYLSSNCVRAPVRRTLSKQLSLNREASQRTLDLERESSTGLFTSCTTTCTKS